MGIHIQIFKENRRINMINKCSFYAICVLVHIVFILPVTGLRWLCQCVTSVPCTLIPVVQYVTAHSCQLPLGSFSGFLFPSEIRRWRMRSVTPLDCSSKGDSSAFIDGFGYGAHTDCESVFSVQESLPSRYFHLALAALWL